MPSRNSNLTPNSNGRNMKIKQFKVAVAVRSEIKTIDGLEYEGKLWLVSLWADNLRQKISKPEIMIRFDLT